MYKKIFIVACLLGFSGQAIFAEPAWKKTIPDFTPGDHPEIRPQTLSYEMSWNGAVKSGRATIIFGKPHKSSKKLFLSQVYGRSTGAAGALFPFNFVYNSFTRKGTNRPLIFISQETDDEERTQIKNTYRSDKVVHTRTDKKLKDGKEKTRTHNFEQRNLHDPLSAMLYIRGRALKNGDVIRLALHPFKSAQYAEVTVLGREPHGGYNCIKLDLKIHNIDRETQQLKVYKKLKKATLWISDDKDRVLVELRSKVFIGDVRMVLSGRKNTVQ